LPTQADMTNADNAVMIAALAIASGENNKLSVISDSLRKVTRFKGPVIYTRVSEFKKTN